MKSKTSSKNSCGRLTFEVHHLTDYRLIDGPKGSRNKLSDVLLSVVVDDFAEHGAEAISQLRQKDPATYLRLVASLVPREMILQREEALTVDYAELTDAEIVALLEEQQRRKFIENALNSVEPFLSRPAR
ncbi:MAG: hypothetical protein HEQ16_11275 [Bosea sp.]|nr:hypothetical protein [Bosea sp. (in: a-proteobacteria)]